MREDHLEAMEKMFPEGFILLRIREGNRVQLVGANKAQNMNLHMLIILISEIIKELGQGEK